MGDFSMVKIVRYPAMMVSLLALGLLGVLLVAGPQGMLARADAVPVTSITVGGTGGASTIETSDGTLRMVAVVEPSNASNKTIVWSVTDQTGAATIDRCGLLTAVMNGMVLVRGTSSSTPSISGTQVITLTNQATSGSAGLSFTLINGDTEYEVAQGDLTGVTSIVIPALYEGKAVTAIQNYGFASLTNLQTVTLPGSIVSIGDQAFGDCDSLSSISLSSNVAFIGSYAFYSCNSLTAFSVSSGNTEFSSISGNLYNVDGTTLISYAIGKTNTSFTIPSSVTTIADWAFYEAIHLSSIAIPGTVSSIGKSAFRHCSALAAISIPSGVTMLDESTFSECSALASVSLPASMQTIGQSAFAACTSLTSITVPDSVTTIAGFAFSGSGLTSFTFPSGVSTTGDYAFARCYGLNSITVPLTVTSLGEGTFYQCTHLNSISLPTTLTAIGAWTFSECYELASITLPASLNTIGARAFDTCTSLTSIIIPSSVGTLGIWTFKGCTSLTIYCVASSQPGGWDSQWNPDGRLVHWGYSA